MTGIQALLACGIAHGDIKCENVLVYNTNNGTAENWVAKLSDFGNVVVGLNSRSSPEKEMAYTEPYNPPELPDGHGMVESSFVEKADMWGWAMLLWYVMIDGNLVNGNYWDCEDQQYSESKRQEIDEKHLSRLKQTGKLASVASHTSKVYLNSTHTPSEIGLVGEISDILNTTLNKDPSKRPCIGEMYQRLVRLHDGPLSRIARVGTRPAVQENLQLETWPEPRPISEMPFFSVS